MDYVRVRPTPTVGGADKFLNAMIDWVQYLAPVIPRTIGIPPEVFLRGVGIVEIGLGILIAFVQRRGLTGPQAGLASSS